MLLKFIFPALGVAVALLLYAYLTAAPASYCAEGKNLVATGPVPKGMSVILDKSCPSLMRWVKER